MEVSHPTHPQKAHFSSHPPMKIFIRVLLAIVILGAVFVIRFPSTESVRIQPDVRGSGTLGHTLNQTIGICSTPTDRP